jgi:hypothetical protein
MIRVVERVNWHWKQRAHLRVAAAVLDTPPIVPAQDGVILFSMIGTRVLLPYLVAVKSLHQQLGRGRAVILDDGTLTAADKALLDHHLGRPAIHSIHDVDTGPCPHGGAWERFLTLLDLRRDDYVIQLDSDTVTVGPVPEVAAAVADGRSFTLMGDANARIMPAADLAAMTADEDFLFNPRAHVQGAIECGMDRLVVPQIAHPLYVRGCAGFAGFAPSKDGRGLAEAFSREAQALLGADRWAQWGSEQVASNFVIANEPDARLLRYDRYLNFWNEGVPADARFIHFIGTYRYTGRAYIDATRQAVAALRGDRRQAG